MKVVFVLLLLDVVLVFGQAPGDFQNICRTNFRYRAPHDWIPYVNDTAVGVRGDVKWQVLVDQYDYQHILGQDSIPRGVWLQRDIDGDGVQFTQSGTTCTNTLRLRNTYSNPTSNNWVFTQAVSYLDAKEVIVNATVRFTGCQDRSSLNPPCQNNFVTLYRYDTNSERTTNEITNVTNFKPCFGDRASSRLEQTGSAIINVIKKFDRPDFAMTYLGIQDNGTYGDVRRILVYYRVAQGYEDGLVRCPNIPLPKEDSGESVSNCTCKDNAMPVNSLTRTCNGNGVCEGNPMCVCQPGYQYDETQQVCQACDAGQYLSAGNTSCVACPANSTSTRASGYCPCIEGHYRPDIDNIGIKCTAPPPPMTECTSNTAYDTGAVLQWRNPPHCGGRTDCFYRISINNGPAVRHDPTNFNFNALETYTVINLQPDTTYSITVSIHNGVSDQDADNTKLRECQIVVTTIPGSVFMLRGTTYLNNTAAIIEHIGEGEVNSLKCTTAFETCCRSSGQGDFYYPNGAQVMIESGGENFYRTRSSRSISLNRRGGNTPLGEYRCEIPDGRGILQNLYITIGTNTECPVVCPTCPSCPTTPPPPTCGTPTTCTPSPGIVPNPVVFELGGTTYPNNTIVLLEDIGVGDSALLCVSNNTGCCTSTSSGFKGEFYYPNGSVVPILSMQHSFYRNRGSGFIRLNQQLNAVTPPPLGRYRCDIQDDGGVTQSVFINIVQNMSCPTDICTPSPPVSTCPTPSVVNCDDCPTATAQTCPPPTTCPTSDGISFQFGGQTYPNNSVFLMTDIGADDMALMCVTDHTPCCRTSQEGEWFYPNNTPVSTLGAGMNFYRDRGSQTVRLNRRNNALSPTGRYRCTIPDATGTMQTLVANIIDTSYPKLNDPEHCQVTITPTSISLVLPNSTATYTCNTGYQLSETSGRRCQNNGTWTGNEPIGEAVTCSELVNPENGKVTQNGEEAISSTTVGSEVTYSCIAGYELVGVSSRTCGSSGHWSGDAPECIVIDCPQLINPDNGQVTPFGNSPGSIALYKCNEGFEIESGHSATRTCLDGQWSGVPPTCVSVQCPLLDHPDSGLVTVGGDRTPGSVATYSCDGGYSLLGSTTRECLANGTWSNKVPTCSQIGFQLNDNFYSSGKVISFSSIGEGDDALQCITDGECCTPPNRAGEFLYPNGTTVKIVGSGDNLYRNRGVGMIRLNRRNEASSPTGTYTCQIPDSSGELQNIFITLN